MRYVLFSGPIAQPSGHLYWTELTVQITVFEVVGKFTEDPFAGLVNTRVKHHQDR